jgi:hypothetical protein
VCPCDHSMVRSQGAGGDNLKVAGNISKKLSRTADKGWSSSFVYDMGLNS